VAIDGRLAGFDHGTVEDFAGSRVDDLGDLAPVAVGVVDAQGDDARGDAAQVVAALDAPGPLLHLRGVDAVEADLELDAVAGGPQGVAVVDAADLTGADVCHWPEAWQVDAAQQPRAGDADASERPPDQ
jgi:hypothetical protein